MPQNGDYHRRALHFLAALLLLVSWPALMLAAIVAPLDEPFRNWDTYFIYWIKCAGVLFGVLSILALVCYFVMACFQDERTYRVVHTVPGAFRAWWVSILVLAWSAAYLVAAPAVNPDVGIGVLGSTENLGMLTTLAVLISSCGGSLVVMGIAYAATSRGMRKAWRQQCARASRDCTSCGYCLHGVPHKTVCPECGTPRMNA